MSHLLRSQESSLLEAWLAEQRRSGNVRNLIADSDLKRQSAEFIQLLQQTVAEGDSTDYSSSTISREMRRFLDSITGDRAQLGFSPSETATFIFSFKRPLFEAIRTSTNDVTAQIDEVWNSSLLLDRLGLYVTESHQKAREGIILRQQQEMLELSTPVVKLWDGVLALPIIGTLDSSRTQTIMESLLERIVETGSEIAIIDITGVPTVDTLTAQHLLKTVTAARLMGAECIISGIRPQIAQTIVHLGVELGDVVTKASLADAFKIALQRTGFALAKRSSITAVK
ncbi:STAS domain-containing protein [Granulicella rosea]|uniref:STAS domain-containing protein n=1 Tax=Granulicella rosea TaxID=474952 RepID=UPI001FEC7B95|nr:STAS domain-containing protein [Granulicella rosea]